MNILITYIATKGYKCYEPLFYYNLRKFYPEHKKIFHTFTDLRTDKYTDNHTYINDLPWPLVALMKFRYIKDAIDNNYIGKVDYVFNFDSEMRFNKIINSDMICDKLIAIPHHYWKLYPNQYDYYDPNKTDKSSKAYFDHVDTYVNSGIFGGPIDLMTKALDTLVDWVECDLKNNIIPQWHDESYWNKYVKINQNIVKILDQSYNVEECFKEQIKAVDEIKIGRFMNKEIDKQLDGLKVN